jgi:hypothetical protein
LVAGYPKPEKIGPILIFQTIFKYFVLVVLGVNIYSGWFHGHRKPEKGVWIKLEP